mmetsp:Transcript_28631/g.83891  ORF Transcript_28631/g.83891 Transcript_28631/m.83891 type:complete len:372 (+) Transcript_28631:57-1172(+)
MISVRWHTSSAGPLQSHRGGRAAVTDPPHTNSRAGSVRRVASSVAAAPARAAFAAAARGFCGGERARGWLPSALAPHGRSPTGVVIWNPAKLMLGCSVGGCHYLLLPVGTRRLSLVCSSSPSARHRSSCMRRSRHSCLSRSRESLPSPACLRTPTSCSASARRSASCAASRSPSLSSASHCFFSSSSRTYISSDLRLATSAFCRAALAASSSCWAAAMRASADAFAPRALSIRPSNTIVTSARNEKVSLRCRQCSSDLRSLKRAISSFSSFSARSFSASTSRCVFCTSDSSLSTVASAASASARRCTAASMSASAACWRCASLMAAASASVTHSLLVRTACIHSTISFSVSAASTTDSPPECESTNVKGRP